MPFWRLEPRFPSSALSCPSLAPTILTGVDEDSDYLEDRNLWASRGGAFFFSSGDEALELANNSWVGFAGYFCTQDLSRAFRFAKRYVAGSCCAFKHRRITHHYSYCIYFALSHHSLECGLVGVNEGIIATCAAPFGSGKESGLGRERGTLGLSEFLETKYVFMNA